MTDNLRSIAVHTKKDLDLKTLSISPDTNFDELMTLDLNKSNLLLLLQGMSIGNKGAELLSEKLVFLPKLTHLHIYFEKNQLGSEAACSLGRALKSLVDVK